MRIVTSPMSYPLGYVIDVEQTYVTTTKSAHNKHNTVA
jgi:hypothetical protein